MEELTLEERLNQQNLALKDISQIIFRERRLEKIFQKATRVAVSVTGARQASIWTASPDGLNATCTAMYDGLMRQYSCGKSLRLKHLSRLFGRDRRFVLLQGEEKLGNRQHLVNALSGSGPISSLLAAPLRKQGCVRGALILTSPCPEKMWTVDEQHFIASVAELLGNYLESLHSKKVRSELSRKENIYQAIFENTGTATIIINEDGTICLANSEFCRLSGYSRSEIQGRKEHWQFFHPRERERISEYHKARREDPESAPRKYEAVFARKNGDERHVLISVDMIPETRQSVASVADMTTQKKALEQLSHQALHDELTGLPNKILFLDRLERALSRSKRDARYKFAVLYLDLDRFKIINECFGHKTGDDLLLQIRDRIRQSVGDYDTIARFGGDEFAILLEGISGVRDATRAAEKIHEQVTMPVLLQEHHIFPGASIGIVFSDNQQMYANAEEILRDTDIAMYRTKQSSDTTFKIFSSRMHDQAVEQLRLESDLRLAHERGELVPYFQPIVSLPELRLTGFETLLRWKHPQKGMIDPDRFIPIAEETGMIVPIGRSALKQALAQLRIWQGLFPEMQPVKLTVNISARQLTHLDFVSDVEHALEECGCSTSSLVFEITETSLLENEILVRNTLQALKGMGISLCLDDFGTGYSALSYLHTFPIDYLKVDKMFTCGAGEQMSNEKIVRTIIHMARDLGLGVVVEGVETQAQLERVMDFQSESAQGFLFSGAVPAKEATRMIRSMRDGGGFQFSTTG
ncbi:MAG: putative bifunctional diguanylate cyclase/phosphodiesterase, partial [Desulfovibrionales bacterium]